MADENYAQHAAVMLTSLFETNRDKAFNVFFMTYSLSDESEKRLEAICQDAGSHIYFIEDEYEQIKDFKVGQWNSI